MRPAENSYYEQQLSYCLIDVTQSFDIYTVVTFYSFVAFKLLEDKHQEPQSLPHKEDCVVSEKEGGKIYSIVENISTFQTLSNHFT